MSASFAFIFIFFSPNCEKCSLILCCKTLQEHEGRPFIEFLHLVLGERFGFKFPPFRWVKREISVVSYLTKRIHFTGKSKRVFEN